MTTTASTLSMIACFDALAIEVMKKNRFTKEEFSVNHPSVAVGARIQSGLESKEV